MTQDLLTQLAEYGTYCDERQGAVSADDVTDAVTPLPMPTQPTRPRQGWLIAAAAAAAVMLVLLGGLALLDPFAVDEVAPTNEPVVTTLPEQVTVPEPETLTDTTASTTTLTTVAIAAAPPDTFDRLDDALAHAPVYHRFGYEVTAELEYLDTYIEGLAGPSVWPRPEFDTSALGAESVLIELPPSALTSVSRVIGAYPLDEQPVVEQPLVAGAQLSGTGYTATFSITIGFKDDGAVSPHWTLVSAFEGGAHMQLGRMDDQDPPHIILMGGGWSDDSPTVIGGLPPEASVVATTLGDGTNVWQRPISGIAIFLDPSPQCIDPNPGRITCSAEFMVLDVNGNEILRLQWAGDYDLHPLWYTVTTP